MCPSSLSQAPSLLDAERGPLLLQICGGSRRGQLVPFFATKCTVGSGLRCTHRIVARGVQPLHCLIVRGAAATVVRSLSPQTRLNGQYFHDAVLRPGDRLSIGPVDFQVVCLQALNSQPPYPKAFSATSGPTLTQSSWSAHEGPSDTSTQLRRGYPEHSPRYLATATPDETQPPGAATELDTRQTELDLHQAELDARQAEIERRQAELDRRQAELRRLHAELEEHRTDLRARQAELEARAAHLDRRQAELDEHFAARDAWNAEAQARQKALDARKEELDRLEGQLNARQEELARWEQSLRKRHQELDQRLAELEGREAQLAQREAAGTAPSEPSTPEMSGPQLSSSQVHLAPSDDGGLLRQEDVPSVPVPADAPQTPWSLSPAEKLPSPSNAPVDTETILRRLGIHLPVDDEPDETVATGGNVEGRPGQLPRAQEEEESIDAYMARLLERLRSGRGEAEAAESPESAAAYAASAGASPIGSEERSGPGAGAGAGSQELATDSPPGRQTARRPGLAQSVAPEDWSHLAAMRELANLSARNALDRHGRNMLRRAIRSKLAVLALALASGSALVGLWWHLGAGDLAYYTALVCYLVAVVWGIQYAVLTGRLIVSRSGHLGWHAPPKATPSAKESPAQSKTSLPSQGSTSPA